MFSFGLGALLVTAAFMVVLQCHQDVRFHFSTAGIPMIAGGAFWCLGNLFNTAAVLRGENSIVMAQYTSMMLITSGFWGIFYCECSVNLRRWLFAASLASLAAADACFLLSLRVLHASQGDAVEERLLLGRICRLGDGVYGASWE